jgi:hypothetical protein
VDEDFEPDEFIIMQDPKSGETVEAGFSVRPFVSECLEFANLFFEVAIFTAGHQWFAEKIIDFIDPTGSLIQHRFYHQHTCMLGEEDSFLLVKDLSIFKGDIKVEDILIIDNNIYSFAFNLMNGIPIVSFMGDKKDCELLLVMQYLNVARMQPNLMEFNESQYKLDAIFNSNIHDFIHHYNIDDWSETQDEYDFDDDGITAHSNTRPRRPSSIEGENYAFMMASETNSSHPKNMLIRSQLDQSECSIQCGNISLLPTTHNLGNSKK